MAAISTWSTTAASNNSASPDGAPEGWAPSEVNNWGRETMAALRTWYEEAEWITWGHTIGFVSGTQFTTAVGDGDTTAIYHVGRRVRETGSLGGPFYGRITASSHAAQTTVTVTWDSGALDAGVTAMAVGAASASSPSIDVLAIKRAQTDVITTRGDVIRGSSSNAAERLAIGAAETVLQSDGTDAAWVDPRASQAELEAGTDETVYATAGRMKYHDGVAKAAVHFDGGDANIDGTATKYGDIGTLTDNGTGDYTIAFSTAFSSAGYVAIGMASVTSGPLIVGVTSQLVGSCRVSVTDNAGTPTDPDFISLAFFGDQ